MKQPILLICFLAAPAAFAQTSTAIPVHRALTTPKAADIVVSGPPYNATCNGTADDTAALNAAAAAANAAGGGAMPAGRPSLSRP